MKSLTIRYDDDVHRKLKIIAAYKDLSLNAYIAQVLRETTQCWESEHGPLVLPDEARKQ